jgi:hypothetical protein
LQESRNLTETSDREIYQVVMPVDAIEARENIDINGGDDEDCVPTDPEPVLCRVRTRYHG